MTKIEIEDFKLKLILNTKMTLFYLNKRCDLVLF